MSTVDNLTGTSTLAKKTNSYFKESEFVCNCGCGEVKIDPRLLKMLNEARDYAGIPFKINSGYRCKEHNAKEGGSKTSSHLSGLAADISAVTGNQKFIIVKACIHAGFNRIGIGSNFVHVDVDDRSDKTQDTIWLY